ncbi:hypothetical protein Rhal01_02882 [Rubritalea halochordaticola]|uniref:WD40 repeat domain-containing protein n=1 Tax=Rubritalea halochordaticola TaxID=714537 RepID=A0ABP9V5R6_9BACT
MAVWLLVGALLYSINVKLMSTHWSVWKQVMVLDEELENSDAEWKGAVNQWVDIHESGVLMARTHNDGTIELWDLMDGSQLWRRGAAQVTSPASFADTRARYVGFQGDVLHVLSNDRLTSYNLEGAVIREVPVKVGARARKAAGVSMLVADAENDSSVVIDLRTYKMWKIPGVMQMENGQPRMDISPDEGLVMLGDRGQVRVFSLVSGGIVYEWTGDPLKMVDTSIDTDLKQVIKQMDQASIKLEKQIAENTQMRNSMPTEARMTQDGKTLILLFSNHLDEKNPSKRKTRIQALDMAENQVIWETEREGKCDEVHFLSTPDTFYLRQMLDGEQVLVTYEVDTGTVMNELPFSIIKERPIGRKPVRGLSQEHFYLDPSGERVVFTGSEPWISKVDENPSLFPLFISKADVPLVRFSSDGDLVATYSASGVVRVFYVYGREALGYFKHPLGWLLYFSWVIWGLIGVLIIWKWAKDEHGLKMPAWLGLFLGLQCMRMSYHFTNIAAVHARSIVEVPWEGSRQDLFGLFLLIVCVLYFVNFWLIRGANWSRLTSITVLSIKCCSLLLSGLIILGVFESHWDIWQHEWWGTPVMYDSAAYISYISITWVGAFSCLVLLLSKDSAQWCKRWEEKQRAQTMKELTQTRVVPSVE